MENIVDYLIVAFFIISFLSSFFKKKKPQKSVQERKQKPAVNLQRDNIQENRAIQNKSRPQKKSSFEEILKAMLEVPEPVTEVPEQKSEVDAYFEEAMKNSSMEEEVYKEEPKLAQVNVSKEEEANNPNTYLNMISQHHQRHTSKKALKIRNDLLNKQTIKEYIVMNEILGKPLALRE